MSNIVGHRHAIELRDGDGFEARLTTGGKTSSFIVDAAPALFSNLDDCQVIARGTGGPLMGQLVAMTLRPGTSVPLTYMVP